MDIGTRVRDLRRQNKAVLKMTRSITLAFLYLRARHGSLQVTKITPSQCALQPPAKFDHCSSFVHTPLKRTLFCTDDVNIVRGQKRETQLSEKIEIERRRYCLEGSHVKAQRHKEEIGE